MNARSERKPFSHRGDYRHFLPIVTRWMDNDLYGHLNNVVYYSFFDTVANRYLIDGGFLDPARSDIIGLVVETRCRYAKALSFPEPVTAGLRVVHMGKSSVRYEVGLFRADEEDAAAEGLFMPVSSARRGVRPRLPEALRNLLTPLLLAG